MASKTVGLRAQVPKGPGSPPVPVMHSPPRAVSVKDQQDWKIPPCISNWKNPKARLARKRVLLKCPAVCEGHPLDTVTSTHPEADVSAAELSAACPAWQFC